MIKSFILLLFICFSFQSSAQSNITFSLVNAPLETVFKEIKKQAGIDVFYKHELLENAKRVTVHFKNATVDQVLERCLKDQDLTYVIIGNTIVLKQREKSVITNPESNDTKIKGKVVDVDGVPVDGATVQWQNSEISTQTNSEGDFSIKPIDYSKTLIISHVTYQTKYNTVEQPANKLISITLERNTGDLENVVVSTGYQDIPKERSTGSFVQVNAELLNRSVSTNIIDRLEGVTSGLAFNRKISPEENESLLSVHGRSTIYANTSPLIILDNFPYTGDLNNINPNDVESISILKDAAAASIWGARAGNGVIVITTRKGRYGQQLKVSITSNISIADKPDLFYAPVLSPSDYVDVETSLFEKGFYNTMILSANHPALPLTVEILLKKQNNIISASEAQMQIDALKQQDIRRDLEKYFYRKSIAQQYAISLSGGGKNNKYFFSAGYDKNLNSLITNQYDRFTLQANNTYGLLNQKIELTTGIVLTQTNNADNTKPTTGSTPYYKLADENGNALGVPSGFSIAYIDTVGGGKLYDWQYKPLDELKLKNATSFQTDYRINIGLKMKVQTNIDFNLLYQYNKGLTETKIYQQQDAFFVRDLINKYTQVNSATGALSYAIPLGDIVDIRNGNYAAHNIRGQVNYNKSWKKTHYLTAIAGAELSDYSGFENSGRLYGYNKELAQAKLVDYTGLYALYYNRSSQVRIPSINSQLGTIDRYVSYYLNAAYTFNQKYTLSVSGRKDASNIFGVKTNQKGVPLLSAGFSWNIYKEGFYNIKWLPLLKLRITSGYSGNVDKTVSAFTTARSTVFNTFGANTLFVLNPPNPSLRWEKVNITNIGIDYGLVRNRLEGSVEFYFKRGIDLIGLSPVDRTTGVGSLKGNSASITTQGIDVSVTSKNIDKRFKWTTHFLYNYTADKVTEFKLESSSFNLINYSIPAIGYPYSGLFSYKWAGLDAQGNPQGFVKDALSKDYSLLTRPPGVNDVVYNGRGRPSMFGSMRNTFSYNRIEMSFNILYQLGYYFRAPSIDYNALFSGAGGHTDYTKRWQSPGDEKLTNIPSIVYPGNFQRDQFYNNSEILVEKGDNIRLQDVQMSYSIAGKSLKVIKAYSYVSNLGLLWQANNKNLDPDYTTPPPLKVAIGVRLDF